MRTTAALLLVAAVLCGAFACWGLFTTAGARRFDEMAGMIPFFAGLATAPLALAAAVAALLARRRR